MTGGRNVHGMFSPRECREHGRPNNFDSGGDGGQECLRNVCSTGVSHARARPELSFRSGMMDLAWYFFAFSVMVSGICKLSVKDPYRRCNRSNNVPEEAASFTLTLTSGHVRHINN